MDKKISEFVGSRIKSIRLSRKLTQKELGEKLGVKHNTISSYEKGTNEPELDILFRMSEILDISINDFFPYESEIDIFDSSKYSYLPTAISAGLPLDVEGITESETITIPDALMGKWAGYKDIFVTRIFGQSMNRVMQDGSLIAIKPVEPEILKNGDIVVYKYDNEYAVKRYYDHGDMVVFRPDSDDLSFTDMVIPKNSELELKIKGKVVLYIVELD